MRPRKLVAVGEVFGRLTVTACLTDQSETRARVLCSCGAVVVVYASNLRKGTTRSCGCLAKTGPPSQKMSTAYSPWLSAKTRCFNPNAISFPNYGGRGISMCPEWSADFKVFLSDMGPRPSLFHQIDRIDNDGDYEPGNCRWVTRRVQANNKRNNKILTINGESKTMAEWSASVGIPYHRLVGRINLGWSPEKAIARTRYACVLR